MDTKLVARFAFRESMGVALMGVALFWSAGRTGWWSAWALLALTLAWAVATGVVILRYNPDLLAERLGPRKGAKLWDTAIMSAYGLLQLVVLIVAGLDQRYGWTGPFPPAAQAAALAVCLLGYGLAVWATASNAYFSQIVRVQAERGHRVATGGPYQYVRHPAYVGSVLTSVAGPILLGSWSGVMVGLASAVLMLLRTALEDRTLRTELPGYADYAQKVRHRLLPGVW